MLVCVNTYSNAGLCYHIQQCWAFCSGQLTYNDGLNVRDIVAVAQDVAKDLGVLLYSQMTVIT